MAAPVGVVSFLKAPSRLLLAPRDALGENHDPVDWAVAVLQCRVLLEGIAWEALSRRRSASSSRGYSFTVEGSFDL